MDPSHAGREVWAVLELLDRQLVDREGRLVGKVDDVEFAIDDEPDALPHVTALLSGLGALANHIGGDTGAALAAAERRLAERRDRQPSRIDIATVTDIGVGRRARRRRRGPRHEPRRALGARRDHRQDPGSRPCC